MDNFWWGFAGTYIILFIIFSEIAEIKQHLATEQQTVACEQHDHSLVKSVSELEKVIKELHDRIKKLNEQVIKLKKEKDPSWLPTRDSVDEWWDLKDSRPTKRRNSNEHNNCN
jgi:DNA-binding transcriptional MerR regulator